jgi:hypothetical protein
MTDLAQLPPDDSPPASGTGMGLATAGLICGLAGLFLLGPILGVLAIIFGAIGMGNAAANPVGAGKSLARASLVLGLIDIGWFVVAIATH